MTAKNNNDRQQVNYNKPVGIKDGSIYFLNYVFDHSDNFRGATGTVLDPITSNYIENITTEDWTEYSRDLWKSAVETNSTEDSLEDYAVKIKNESESYGQLFPGHDDSYSEFHKEAKKHFNSNVETFNCSGGGRCFNLELLNSFDKVIDQDLIDLIKSYEAENETKAT
jgi:hypothetical protein